MDENQPIMIRMDKKKKKGLKIRQKKKFESGVKLSGRRKRQTNIFLIMALQTNILLPETLSNIRDQNDVKMLSKINV